MLARRTLECQTLDRSLVPKGGRAPLYPSLRCRHPKPTFGFAYVHAPAQWR
jgi:hypothetical protein